MSELILTAATVITMNDDTPRAQAVAVSGDGIVAVGSLEQCRAALPDAEVVDTDAAALAPGFVEPHSHPLVSGVATQAPARSIAPWVATSWAEVQAMWRIHLGLRYGLRPEVHRRVRSTGGRTRTQTVNAARTLRREHLVGSISVGKLADFVELTADPWAVDPAHLIDTVQVAGDLVGRSNASTWMLSWPRLVGPTTPRTRICRKARTAVRAADHVTAPTPRNASSGVAEQSLWVSPLP